MALKTIIYDFDGTIADSMSASIEVYNRIAAEKGFKTVNENNLQALRSEEPRKILKELGISIYQVPALLLRGLKELKPMAVKMSPHSGVVDAVSQLKKLGFRQVILTTNILENVEGFLKKNDLSVFDFIYSGSSAFGKGRLLKNLLKDKGLSNTDVIYIGDEVRDIEGAKQAQIKFVGVGWGYNTAEALRKNGADYIIKTPQELIKLAMEFD